MAPSFSPRRVYLTLSALWIVAAFELFFSPVVYRFVYGSPWVYFVLRSPSWFPLFDSGNGWTWVLPYTVLGIISIASVWAVRRPSEKVYKESQKASENIVSVYPIAPNPDTKQPLKEEAKVESVETQTPAISELDKLDALAAKVMELMDGLQSNIKVTEGRIEDTYTKKLAEAESEKKESIEKLERVKLKLNPHETTPEPPKVLAGDGKAGERIVDKTVAGGVSQASTPAAQGSSVPASPAKSDEDILKEAKALNEKYDPLKGWTDCPNCGTPRSVKPGDQICLSCAYGGTGAASAGGQGATSHPTPSRPSPPTNEKERREAFNVGDQKIEDALPANIKEVVKRTGMKESTIRQRIQIRKREGRWATTGSGKDLEVSITGGASEVKG